MYYIGFDLGSSSVKVALVEIATGKSIGVAKLLFSILILIYP
jgi:xylulokinase